MIDKGDHGSKIISLCNKFRELKQKEHEYEVVV